MAQRTWHLFTLITIFTVLSIVGDVFSTSPAPWYENLPAVTMDYKVHIDAGKEDCYYQYVQPGATFYASYQVIICNCLLKIIENRALSVIILVLLVRGFQSIDTKLIV